MPVIFDSEQRRLVNGDSVTLLTPQQTDCLLLLSSVRGEVVKPEEFLRKCWTEKGLVVSNASVRVALYQLRKQLTAAGIPANALVTEVGRGYRLREGFIKQAAQENTLHAETPAVSPDAAGIRYEGRRIFNRRLLWALISMILICSGFLAGFLRLESLTTPLHYRMLSEQSDMHILIQEGMEISAERVRENYQSAAQWLPDRFPAPWIYVNQSLHRGSLSALICDRIITDPGKQCYSLHREEEL